MSLIRGFLDRRALQSWETLLKLAKDHPTEALRILNQAAGDSTPYPLRYIAAHTLGQIVGACSATLSSRAVLLESIKGEAAFLFEHPPGDFIGPNRKYGRGGGT
jgi:hypothetical protein